jgi:hypothetical protein
MKAEIAAAAEAGLQAVEAGFPVQTDANLPFDRPDNGAWARVSFRGGAKLFESIGGVGGNLERGPLIAYCDIFTPLGEGDGRADELGVGVENEWRRLVVPGARFDRFQEEAAEGIVDGQWRKQIAAVFLQSQRV